MRNVNDLYNFCVYIVSKTRGEAFLTTDEVMQALHNGQMDAVQEWFSGYGENQILHDALRPLRTYVPFTSDSSGFVTFPSNYIHLLGNPFTVTGSTVNPIHFVNEDELPLALTSQLRPVSTSYPIAVDTATGFSIYPQTTQLGAYFYLRTPTTPVWGGTLVGRVLTYNPATSTQMDFSDAYLNHILAKALVYIGVNINEEGVFNFANQYNQETAA